MHSTHDAELNVPTLPLAARKAHIVPALHSLPLLSIGQLCDAGCQITLDADRIQVKHNDNIALTGLRNSESRLWHVDLAPTCPTTSDAGPTTTDQNVPTADQHCLGAIGSATPADLVAFAHASLFSPALPTLAKAIDKGFLTNFPGLTAKALRKYPPQSYAMVKGHLDQVRQNLRSTKADTKPTNTDDSDDSFPDSTTAERSHHCYATLFEPTGQIYTDQTGRFVLPSSTGNQYLLVLYDYDSNCILAQPLKTRHATAILQGYKVLHERLCRAGLKPQLQRLDNECSDALKEFMSSQDIDYQLVPPGVHRRNSAECAIRTFKNHFIAGLCSLDKEFPLHLWDRLIPQAEITLNLMRASRLNPNMSAWTQLHGTTFDYNRTPLAPPGIRVLVHEKPAARGTWSPHAMDGWYTGPALDSYRCYKVWIWATRQERICDTLSWFPSNRITMPLATSADLIAAGIADIADALKNPTPDASLIKLPPSHVAALKNLADVLTGEPTEIAPPFPTTTIPPTKNSTTTNTPTAPLMRVVPAVDPAPSLRVASMPLVPTPAAPPSLPIPEKHVTWDEAITKKPRRRRGGKPSKATTPTEPPPTNAFAAALLTAIPADIPTMPHWALHGHAINPDTGLIAEHAELLKCSDGHHWHASTADEFGRLMKGHGPDMKSGTETMFFIHPSQIPRGKKPTYLRVVCAYRPEKSNPYRVRFTCGGDRVEYAGDVSTKTADLTTVKILLNSVLSTPNAKFMTLDLKDFYLGTPMPQHEYMRIPVKLIPESIMLEYDVQQYVVNGYVIVEIQKGMYGLPQAGRIAYDYLCKHLGPHEYHPCPITPGLWKSDTNDIMYSLVVDDFGIKYTNRDDVLHLVDILKEKYDCSIDWDGERYCGLTLNWDYNARTCDISMPGYIERALQRFQHPAPSRPQHAPHAWEVVQYGAKTQYAPLPDASPALDAADTKRVQEILGTLLFYARAVDSTLLAAIGELASQQAHGTAATMRGIVHLLNYCATHPDAQVRYHKSDMILWVESDASYLSVSKARSRAGGYFFLSSRPIDPTKAPGPNDPAPPANGAIAVLCQIMREVVSSAAEAELAALFHNGKDACPMRITLEELGHPQPATPLQTDNSTACGIANDTVKQKRSKAIDMRFYWIRDRVRQGQFHVHWKKGSLNRADYFTKHHPPSHHQSIRSSYLHVPTDRSKNYFECLTDTANCEQTAGSLTYDLSSDLSQSDCGEGVLNTPNMPNPRHSQTRRPCLKSVPCPLLFRQPQSTHTRSSSSLII